MSQHVSNMAKGALFFTSVYLLLKCVKRLEYDNSSGALSQLCTWSMGALGTGLAVLVGSSLVNTKC